MTNLILNILFLPIWGIFGTAIASTISYFIYGGIYIFLLIRKEHIDVCKMFVITNSDIEMIKRRKKDNLYE